jgi:hypothetical protein
MKRREKRLFALGQARGNACATAKMVSSLRKVPHYVVLDNNTSTPGIESSQPNAFRYDGNIAYLRFLRTGWGEFKGTRCFKA